MEISIYSTIDFSKARNLLTERQKNVKAFNPIVPEGGCISLLEINPKQYISIRWFFINQKTGKITETTAESSDSMHYVAIPEGLKLGTYRLKIETRHLVGNTTINETTISNPFEYVEASEDIATIVSSNLDNNLVGNLRKNAVIIQPIYTNPVNPSGGGFAPLMRTGQVVSWGDYDDGYYESGRLTSFFILRDNNYFGHKQRFTGMTGGYYDQTLQGWYDVSGVATTEILAKPNGIIIDWSTWDELTGDVLWYYDSMIANAINWDNARTGAVAQTFGGFDWRLPNRIEGQNIIYSAGGVNRYALYYLPFKIHQGYFFWLSTSSPDGLNALALANTTHEITLIPKSYQYSNYAYFVCRTGNISEL